MVRLWALILLGLGIDIHRDEDHHSASSNVGDVATENRFFIELESLQGASMPTWPSDVNDSPTLQLLERAHVVRELLVHNPSVNQDVLTGFGPSIVVRLDHCCASSFLPPQPCVCHVFFSLDALTVPAIM